MAVYSVYPMYGYNDNKMILGTSSYIPNDDIKAFRNKILNGEPVCKSSNFIIVDWKRYRIKHYINGHESIWRNFKIADFWSNYRFFTPCEEHEIRTYGHIK